MNLMGLPGTATRSLALSEFLLWEDGVAGRWSGELQDAERVGVPQVVVGVVAGRQRVWGCPSPRRARFPAGVNAMLRKVAVAAASKPHVEIRQDGDRFYIKTSTTVRTTEINFKVGEGFEEETVDGRKCRVSSDLPAPARGPAPRSSRARVPPNPHSIAAGALSPAGRVHWRFAEVCAAGRPGLWEETLPLGFQSLCLKLPPRC